MLRHVLCVDDDAGTLDLTAVDPDERDHRSPGTTVETDGGTDDPAAAVGGSEGRERQFEALNRTLPRLLDADSHEAVARLGVEAARDILGLQANAIHLYDEASGGLEPVAATEALRDLVGDLPTFEGPDSIAWRVFEEGTVSAVDDVRRDPDVYDPSTPVRSELFLPLGEYGVLIAGSETASEFDGRDEAVGELLALHLVTAFEQVDHERRLREREAELEERNERLEQFASMVSHDLRTPVSVATGNLDLYRERGDDEHLDTVARSLDRIEELITDLAALARYGTAADDCGTVAIRTVAEDAWSMVDTGTATLSVEDGTVTADEGQLKALLENLFRNSVEHGSTGSRPEADDSVEHGSTSNRRAERAGDSVEHGSTGSRTGSGDSVEHGSTDDDGLTVRVGPLDDVDGFYVEDTGDGIPPSDRERVFDHGYSTGERGSGIGLTVVGRVAEAHGWDVSVGEGADGGARFEFRAGERDDA